MFLDLCFNFTEDMCKQYCQAWSRGRPPFENIPQDILIAYMVAARTIVEAIVCIDTMWIS